MLASREHLLWDNTLGAETLANGTMRQMSWWRTWHDRDEPSLPKLVRKAERNTVERGRHDALASSKQRVVWRCALNDAHVPST